MNNYNSDIATYFHFFPTVFSSSLPCISWSNDSPFYFLIFNVELLKRNLAIKFNIKINFQVLFLMEKTSALFLDFDMVAMDIASLCSSRGSVGKVLGNRRVGYGRLFW